MTDPNYVEPPEYISRVYPEKWPTYSRKFVMFRRDVYKSEVMPVLPSALDPVWIQAGKIGQRKLTNGLHWIQLLPETVIDDSVLTIPEDAIIDLQPMLFHVRTEEWDGVCCYTVDTQEEVNRFMNGQPHPLAKWRQAGIYWLNDLECSYWAAEILHVSELKAFGTITIDWNCRTIKDVPTITIHKVAAK